MILRRVIDHVRTQNWTAVALDFVIVVMGVFIGLQVSNWNAARQQGALGDAYLARLGDDLSTMERYLERMIAETNARHALTKNLLLAASRDESDDALVDAAHAFFTKGWRTPRLTVVDTVFEDLSSTGNLGLIDEPIRQQITAYYADLEVRKENIEINRDWSLPNDSRMVLAHDVYRWDRTFSEVIGDLDEARARDTILLARADLARLASMFHYIEKDLLVDYAAALEGTRRLATAIASTTVAASP